MTLINLGKSKTRGPSFVNGNDCHDDVINHRYIKALAGTSLGKSLFLTPFNFFRV